MDLPSMELDSLLWRLAAAGAAVAPAATLLIYFSTRRAWRYLRELIWISFGFGFSVAIPIAGIAALYAPSIARIDDVRLHALAVAFLEAAAPEELGKLLVVICIILRHEDLRRPVDAVVLTVLVGLGFATIENLYYVFGAANWTETAILRAVTAVPMHASVGIAMGYFAARWLLASGAAPITLALTFTVPTVLHGLYDYPVFAIQQLLAQADRSGTSFHLEFQGLFFASIALAVLTAAAVCRAIANAPDLTGLAPWFQTAEVRPHGAPGSTQTRTAPQRNG